MTENNYINRHFLEETKDLVRDVVINNNERKIRQLQKLVSLIISSPQSLHTKISSFRIINPVLTSFIETRKSYSFIPKVKDNQLNSLLSKSSNELSKLETASKFSNSSSTT
jgi:hypothetical protein